MKLVSQNPYRILGVLSNTPLKERVGNQNRLSAFAKVGKETTFPNDFAEVISEKPERTIKSIASASTAINLDKDQLKHALFWFIKGTPIDDIALKHLQAGNVAKAKELFQKQETFSSLINSGILAFVNDDVNTGFDNISKVVHDSSYRAKLLEALGITNLCITEDELAEMYISELLKEIPAKKLLAVTLNASDRAIISKNALDEPISFITSAISVAKATDTKNPSAQRKAGTKLMNSTKAALKQIKEIAGTNSPQYQMAADSLAKQILQCGINYYNNATEDDVESPRKAMVLQKYALKIAVGKLVKDRCQKNYDVLKEAVDSMPPASVAIEARKIKDELRRFCQLPDKISHSKTLLNNTKPLLQAIKAKLGQENSFYLSISTQVVGNALHNLIEEVNQVQSYFIEAIKDSGIAQLLNALDSPSKIINTKVKPVVRNAWEVMTLMDSFDMESDFRVNRYTPNKNSLKEMCNSLGISTYIPNRSPTPTQPKPSLPPAPHTTPTTQPKPKPTPAPSSDGDRDSSLGCWIIIAIGIIIIILVNL